MTPTHVWPHLAELPAFRALIRSIEHHLLEGEKPFAAPMLDVGVGDGHFAAVALGPCIDVGIDVDRGAMRQARSRQIYRHLVQGSAASMPFPSNHFRMLISNCVIEHIPDLRCTLAEVHRVLRPGGMVALTVPTDRLETNFVLPAILRAGGLGKIAERYLAWFRRVQVHYHLLSREQWLENLARAGLEVVRQRGYLSRRATAYFELGHYTAWHNLLARRLIGHWVIWPWRPRFFMIERLLAGFVNEPEHEDDSCFFILARKP